MLKLVCLQNGAVYGVIITDLHSVGKSSARTYPPPSPCRERPAGGTRGWDGLVVVFLPLNLLNIYIYQNPGLLYSLTNPLIITPGSRVILFDSEVSIQMTRLAFNSSRPVVACIHTESSLFNRNNPVSVRNDRLKNGGSGKCPKRQRSAPKPLQAAGKRPKPLTRWDGLETTIFAWRWLGWSVRGWTGLGWA
ncbi:hypothetical protein B0H16DRAFT_1806622 [Mycena metata]|uniref:Uncharacterized protein n=1 Tax=Mycena metata TaxID=1033252 RepID=A0AAD7H8C7_9AGAR|nr:hypothetical protein B0H16DRAFT_1806622 [Mycena metata]